MASPGNVPVTLAPDWIDTVFLQVAWGTGLPNPLYDQERLELLRSRFKIIAWAWCVGNDPPEDEAAWHAQRAHEVGADAFVANMEEGYDAHGNQADPRYSMPSQYFNALIKHSGLMHLGLTTTPLFASHMGEWINAGAIFMPQAFPLENHVTVDVAVGHALSWGWPIHQIRPLVQTYQTNDMWPNVVKMSNEAVLRGVGVIPYTLEQVLLTEGGMQIFDTLKHAIIRPNRSAPMDEGEVMQLIGSQHGIAAAYYRMRLLDPEGCNPNFNPNQPDALPFNQLKAWDKQARTLMILAAGHDERANRELQQKASV